MFLLLLNISHFESLAQQHYLTTYSLLKESGLHIKLVKDQEV